MKILIYINNLLDLNWDYDPVIVTQLVGLMQKVGYDADQPMFGYKVYPKGELGKGKPVKYQVLEGDHRTEASVRTPSVKLVYWQFFCVEEGKPI